MNEEKSEVVVVECEGISCDTNVINKRVEEVEEFSCLGAVVENRGRCGEVVVNRVAQGRKVAGPIKALVNTKSLHREAGRDEGVLVLPLLNGHEETLAWHEDEEI